MILSIVKLFVIILHTVIMSIICTIATVITRSNAVFDAIVGFFYQGLLTIGGIKVVVEGKEHIPATGSCIFVANHSSHFDIPASMIGIGTTRLRIIYKKELERIPIFGWAMKWTGMYIAINRGRGTEAQQSLEKAIHRIRNGDSVILYPEGTRTSDGNLQPFKRGAFNLAVKAGVPIVPVTINGSYRILPKDSFHIKPGTISIIIGEPVLPPEEMTKTAELELMETVHKRIEQHHIHQ